MDVILLENIDSLGRVGDLVKVKDGYARNYLIPKGFALAATKRNMKELEHKQRLAESKRKKDLADAQVLVERLEQTKVTIPAKVGEEEKLYGSITRRNIAEGLAKEGLEIDRKNILLEEPIRTTGVFDVEVKVRSELNAKIRVWVVAE